MKEILSNYTSYNLWANKRITELLLENISLLDKEVKSSFTSLRKTMNHLWGAEEIWYKRLCGESLAVFPDPVKDFLEFTKQFSARSQSYIDLVNSKDEKYFMETCSYKAIVGTPFTNTPWQIIMHCMNHSTYHRGQIVTILREVGVTTIPSTDMIGYFREQKP